MFQQNAFQSNAFQEGVLGAAPPIYSTFSYDLYRGPYYRLLLQPTEKAQYTDMYGYGLIQESGYALIVETNPLKTWFQNA